MLGALTGSVTVVAAQSPSLRELVQESLQKRSGKDRLLVEMVFRVILGDLDSEKSTEAASTGNEFNYLVGREKEISEILQVLSRVRGAKSVALVGEAGVGKSAVIQGVLKKIRNQNVGTEETVLSRALPPGTKVVSINPQGLVSIWQWLVLAELMPANLPEPMAARLVTSELFRAIHLVQSDLNQAGHRAPIVLRIERLEEFDPPQFIAIQDELNGPDPITLILEGTKESYEQMIRIAPALNRWIVMEELTEPSESETLEMIKKSAWLDQIKNQYRLQYSEEVLAAAVRNSYLLTSHTKAQPEASFEFIQDLAIYVGYRDLENSDSNKTKIPTLKDVSEYVSTRTKLPVDGSDRKAVNKFFDRVEEEMNKRIIDQPRLTRDLVAAAKGLVTSGAKKQVRSVMVLGPTGVGKTESIEELVDIIFGSAGKEVLFKLKGTELQMENDVTKLVSSPPGYIGHDPLGGPLVKFMRGKEFVVLQVDEVEKAHKNVNQLLMELNDKGIISDVEVGKLLIVYTGNQGAKEMATDLSVNASPEQINARMDKLTVSEIKGFFRSINKKGEEPKWTPEMLQRISDFIPAGPISFESAVKIATLKVEKYKLELMMNEGVEISVDPEVTRWMTQTAYTPLEGARVVANQVKKVLERITDSVEAGRGQKFKVELATKPKSKTAVWIPTLIATDLSSGKKITEVTFPDPPKYLAIQDPRYMTILDNLESNMNQHIRGQTHAIGPIAKAIRKRSVEPSEISQMLTISLNGPTGNGKTETMKALAHELLGDNKRGILVEGAQIQTIEQLREKLFDVIDQGKNTYPEGFVITLDEWNNMGKQYNSTARESLFDALYTLIDESKYTNSKGEAKECPNVILMLTSNIGAERFDGAADDNMKQLHLKNLTKPGVVEQMMIADGIPKPLVYRIPYKLIYGPLSTGDRIFIQEKFINKYLVPIAEKHGIKIEVSEETKIQLSRLFFPLEQGSRGNRNFVKNDLGSVISESILSNLSQIDSAVANGQIPVLRISIDYPFPEKPWAVDSELFLQLKKTKPVLIAEWVNAGKGFKGYQAEAQTSSEDRIVEKQHALQIIGHENGHLLTNEHLNKPAGPFQFLTVRGAAGYGGYFNSEEDLITFENHSRDLKSFIRDMAVYAGGMVGQGLLGFPRTAGWGGGKGSDLDGMYRIAHRAITELGMVEGMEYSAPESSRSDAMTSEARKQKVEAKAQQLISAAIELAEKVLNHPMVKEQHAKLTEIVLNQGTLLPEELNKLIGKNILPKAEMEKMVDEVISKHHIQGTACSDLLSSKE